MGSTKKLLPLYDTRSTSSVQQPFGSSCCSESTRMHPSYLISSDAGAGSPSAGGMGAGVGSMV